MATTINQLIQQHASEAASAGDFDAVAKLLNAEIVRARTTKAYYVEVYETIGDKGMRHVVEVLGEDAIGKGGIARLNDPSADGGLYFAHPITVALIETKRAELGDDIADAMLSLGMVKSSLAIEAGYPDLTADQCREWYLVGSDVLLSVNITDGVTRCSLIVSRNGEQVQLQSLTEGQGSESDQSLLTAIETAINTFLIEG